MMSNTTRKTMPDGFPSSPPRVVAAGDRALLVSFGDEITHALHRRVRRLLDLVDRSPLRGVTDLVPAYASLLVQFDPAILRHRDVESHLRPLIEESARGGPLQEGRLVEIPVCYEPLFAPDLQRVARESHLSVEEVVGLHTGRIYDVYFIGFVPGFAYMGELPEAIALARHATPRREVPAGSVGIAGGQTGVYPRATPGGWHLIGRTPLRMFDPRREPAALLKIGDRVRFSAIPSGDFEQAPRR
jgi:KipI family sensor histidine kinase inhibitor